MGYFFVIQLYHLFRSSAISPNIRVFIFKCISKHRQDFSEQNRLIRAAPSGREHQELSAICDDRDPIRAGDGTTGKEKAIRSHSGH